ncbi:hypothetical protein M5X17_31215 [Paenibacillus alvei]|uniref:hypothetical protein n=1 Tax=Paenibacillus alvei TaxID=44250 RepID=UPI0022832B6F|nr:hypothetical protein [Paenibacillus alvei]MCY9738164.1 hypothetical protein [Paenibacillus alvei]
MNKFEIKIPYWWGSSFEVGEVMNVELLDLEVVRVKPDGLKSIRIVSIDNVSIDTDTVIYGQYENIAE